MEYDEAIKAALSKEFINPTQLLEEIEIILKDFLNAQLFLEETAIKLLFENGQDFLLRLETL